MARMAWPDEKRHDGDIIDAPDDVESVDEDDTYEKRYLRKKRLVGIFIVLLVLGVWAISWLALVFG